MQPAVLLSLLSAAVLAAPIDTGIESRVPCPPGAKRAEAYCLFDKKIPGESEAKRAEAVEAAEAYHDIFLVTEAEAADAVSKRREAVEAVEAYHDIFLVTEAEVAEAAQATNKRAEDVEAYHDIFLVTEAGNH